MNQVPISPYIETKSMRYFARMLDKARKFSQGVLREDFHELRGAGLDARCCDFLRVSYAQIEEQAAARNDNEAILQWCYDHGRQLTDNEILIWNCFINKIGWRDHMSDMLIKRKADAGLADRDDIVTMAEFMEVDEGRKA